MKRTLIVIFLGLLVVGPALKAAAEPQLFRAKTVRGTVQALYPWSASWSPVEGGELLPYGTLVQVFAGGRISLVSQNEREVVGPAAVPVELMFMNLTMIRLDESLVRKGDTQRLYFDSAKKLEAMQNGIEPDSAMEDAWNKLAAYLPGAKASPGSVGPNGMPLVSERLKKIKLLRPVESHDVTPLVLPMEFRVVWKDAGDKNLTYEVNVWRSDELAEAVVGSTKESSYLTQIDDYGSYFVKVRSTDRRYESEAHLLVLRPPVSRQAMKRVRKRHEFPPGEPKISATAPAPDLDLVSLKKRERVDFRWGLTVDLPELPAYELTVFLGVQIVQTLRTTGTAAAVHLGPGSYRWQVKAIGIADTGGSTRPQLLPSPAGGRFTIERPTALGRKRRLSGLAQQIRMGRENRVLYLPDGL